MMNLAILGSTGSIGTSTLAVVQKYPDRYRVAGLAAGSNVELLAQQIRTFAPDVVCLADGASRDRLAGMLPGTSLPELLAGPEGMRAVATLPGVDMIVQAIASGVQDLNRTVTGLLEFTRDRRIARRDTPPGRLAAEVIALVQGELDARTADAAPVTLELADGWRGGPFPLDAAQMKQVLLNLVQNAVHAVSEDRPGGRVRLALTADAAGALVLAVDDDGPGVPEADRATIFTPFFTTRPHGTGLGLAISAAIVQLHGGTIAVETAPLGGARFRVVIPRSGDERTAP